MPMLDADIVGYRMLDIDAGCQERRRYYGSDVKGFNKY